LIAARRRHAIRNHDYTPEQQAFDSGLMDKFVEFAGVGAPGCPDYGFGKSLVMGYFDGNTVTALWNYAQHYAMSDNSFGTTFWTVHAGRSQSGLWPDAWGNPRCAWGYY
jgi:phospholipase C